jgi:uncharacterized membrane protein YhhN
VALTFAICVGVALLVNAERTGDRRSALIFKTTSSLGFVGLAVSVGGLQNEPSRAWIVVGLCLACVGDVSLALPGQRAFVAGLVAFLLGHVAYVAACASLLPLRAWLTWMTPMVTFPIVGSGVVAYGWLFPHLGRLRGPVLAWTRTHGGAHP